MESDVQVCDVTNEVSAPTFTELLNADSTYGDLEWQWHHQNQMPMASSAPFTTRVDTEDYLDTMLAEGKFSAEEIDLMIFKFGDEGENGLKNDQDHALQHAETKFAGEGSSSGSPDSQPRRIARKIPKNGYHRHSNDQVLALRNFYEKETPYPSDRQIYKLSEWCGLTTKQITNWFSNEREKKREQGKSHAGFPLKTKNNLPEPAVRLFKYELLR
ncbi:unnamed protein product [Calypogeia fissa]